MTEEMQSTRIPDSDVKIEKIGVIAGAGALPDRLIHSCDLKGIETFIIGFEGQTDKSIIKGRQHLWTRLGAAGQIIQTLKAHGIKDLVLIGAMRRPGLLELKPDLRTARFFARIGMRSFGDDDLLQCLRKELEFDGFRVHGVQKFATDLLAGNGPVGKYRPDKADMPDIQRGIAVSQALGRLDVGQAVIIQDGIVLGVEAAEGTDELIRRCVHLKRKGRKPILIKSCKPQQDQDLDLPTIGPETIRIAAAAGLGGVVIHAGRSLLLDAHEVAEIANSHNMFVMGTEIKDDAGS